MAKQRTFSHVTAWIGLNPVIRRYPSVIRHIIEDAAVMLTPYGVTMIKTSEPCYYRITTQGLQSLRESISNMNINYAYVAGDYNDVNLDEYATASCELDIGNDMVIATRCTFIVPLLSITTTKAVNMLSEFIKHSYLREFIGSAYIVPFDAAKNDLQLYQTSYEQQNNYAPLILWDEVTKYLRGVFSSNFLGEDLSNRIAAMLDSDTSVPWEVERLDGLYCVRLVNDTEDSLVDPSIWPMFFKPLLIREQIEYDHKKLVNFTDAFHTQAPSGVGLFTKGKAKPYANTRIIDENREGINIHFASPVTGDDLDGVISVVEGWGRMVGRPQHEGLRKVLVGPRINGETIRWGVGYISDQEILGLQEALSDYADLIYINIGTEIVG